MRLRAILVLLLFALWCWLNSRRRCKEGIPITEPNEPPTVKWMDEYRTAVTYSSDPYPTAWTEYNGQSLNINN